MQAQKPGPMPALAPCRGTPFLLLFSLLLTGLQRCVRWLRRGAVRLPTGSHLGTKQTAAARRQPRQRRCATPGTRGPHISARAQRLNPSNPLCTRSPAPAAEVSHPCPQSSILLPSSAHANPLHTQASLPLAESRAVSPFARSSRFFTASSAPLSLFSPARVHRRNRTSRACPTRRTWR
jgi:hypothetical protein